MTEEIRNDDNRRIEMLAKTYYRRRKTHPPDVERAWQAFHEDMERQSAGRTSYWKLLGAAVLGAAAMLAAVVVFQYGPFEEHAAEEDRLVVLDHQDAPSQVTLQTGSRTKVLSGTDSISFRPSARHGIAGVKTASAASEDGGGKTVAQTMQRVKTPRGMSFKVILEDGTEIWLNAESRIEFPERFTGQTRQVRVDGEAYFKVAHNAKVPFIVTSDQMQVRVLGTEFNFRHYAREQAEVSLVKGSVEVLNGRTGRPEAILKPDQQAWYDRQGAVHVKPADTYAVRQWVEGIFYFDEAPLVEILKELGRWYNLGVVFNNPKHQSFRLHFTAMRSDDVRQSIIDLNHLCRFKIAIVGPNIVVN